MNSLKPLLTVAVLAGIGYGVYIRLNAGANAPPPPVDAGWNSTPDIQLPGQTSSAPWGEPGAPGSQSPQLAPGGPPPAFQSQAGTAGEAPPFGQAQSQTAAPPFPSPGSQMPPEAVASATPPQPPAAVPGANPYDQTVPPNPGTEVPGAGSPPPGVPVVDPTGGAPQDAGSSAEPYVAPPAGAAPPLDAPPGSQPPGDFPLPPTDATPADGAPAASGEFASAMESAQRELENGQMASALRQLTGWYGNPQLTPEQQQQLCALLDQVAGTVVYSTQNLLEHPYEVQPGERLETIGEKYQIPWQLLAKINGVEDPASLQPGERLKVVRGPFEAVINLERRELVLHTADGLYAGRFAVGLGGEHPPQEGTFAVSDKSENPVYYGRDRAIGAEDPNNPLGERWIGLGKQMAIHGTNSPENIGRTDLPGWISLSERDVADVYDILSLGSRVTIRR